jgi:hypothetical protein
MALTKKNEYATSDFDGVNTQALRQAIKSGQQAWLENIQPVGPANARVVPAQILRNEDFPVAVPYYAQGFNIIIGVTPVDLVFYADQAGNIWYMNCATYVVTQISTGGNAGKFTQCAAAQWKNERLVIIDNVTGLWTWNGITLTNAGFTAAPSKGQCIATFSGSVWISNNRTIYYTQPDSYTDFSGATGGSIIITDENLHSSIQQLLTSNNFLYVFGVDSVNVFSDVRVSATGRALTNTNLSTGIGTSFPMTCLTYQRSVWFASANGYYGLYGASARKESSELDGMYDLIQDITNPAAIGAQPTMSGGLVSINNILCAAWLFKYQDPELGLRPLLALYFDKKWFFASQGDMVMIADCIVKGKNRLFAWDINSRTYELFADENSAVEFKWQSALWDFQQPVQFKQVIKIGIGAQFLGVPSNIDAYIDTESNQSLAYPLSGGGVLTFYGTGTITFVGTGSIIWSSSGYVLMQTDASNFGRYVGFTLDGEAYQTTFTLAMMEYNYRSQWGT